MARAGFQFAAWASDTESPEREQAAAMASSYAAEAGVRVTGDDIQLHGGVGFTWANDAHFLFKRVKQNERSGRRCRPRNAIVWPRCSSNRPERPGDVRLRSTAPDAGRAGRALPGRGGVGRPLARGVPAPTACSRTRPGASGFGRPPTRYLGTVGDVYEDALRVAGGLRALGLGPGDMVAFQLPNWVEAAITFYACAMLGVTLVPIVHFYGPKEVGFILRQSGARALVIVSRIGQRDYLADLATHRATAWTSLEHVMVVGDIAGDASGYVRFDDLRSAEPVSGPAHVDPDGPALIGYTSGTTADPKGVVHTHRTLGCEVRQLSDHQAMRDLPSLVGRPGRPRHRDAGRAALPARTAAGRIYMIDGWDPPTVLAAMVEEHIAAGSGSTYFFTSLLDSPGFGPEHVELMRFIGLGGSPIPERGGGTGGRARASRWCAPTAPPSTLPSPGHSTTRPRTSGSTPTAGRWTGWRSGPSTRTATTWAWASPARS